MIKLWGFFIAKKGHLLHPLSVLHYYEQLNDNFGFLPKFLLTTTDLSILTCI